MSIHDFPLPRSRPFDPPDALAEARMRDPISKVRLWDGRDAWLVTRYEDVRLVLQDPRFSADLEKIPPTSPSRAYVGRTALSRIDNPKHGKLRRTLADEFLASRISALRPCIARIVSSHLDVVLGAAPPIDFHAMFALPVAARVISELLGIPASYEETFQKCTDLLVSRNTSLDSAAAADDELYVLCERLFEHKERKPADDMISRLIINEVNTSRLDREDAILLVKLLIVAGHVTTANMTSLGTLTMLLNSEWFRLMRESAAQVANAVEELLRYHTLLHDGIPRAAKEDVRIAGTLITAGDGVVVSLASGNRDEAIFDHPDKLDMKRPNARRHLSFGYGPHQCLGQWLARAELQIALSEVAKRIPGLRLAVPLEELVFKEDMHVYGVRELPVTW